MRPSAAALALFVAGCYAATEPPDAIVAAPDGGVPSSLDSGSPIGLDAGPPVLPPPVDSRCGGAVRLSPDEGALSWLGQLSLTREGVGRVIYVTCEPGGCFVQLDRYDSTSASWTVSERVDSADLGGVEETRVAVSPSGETVAAWTRVIGAARTVFVARELVGAPFESPIAATDDGAWEEVVVNAAGGALAVWHQPSTSSVFDRVLYAAESPPSTIGAGVGDALYPRLAIDDAGNTYAAWSEQGAVWARAGVGLSVDANPPQRLGALAPMEFAPGSSVAIAASASSATVVWAGDGEGVYAAAWSGAAWSSAQRIDTIGAGTPVTVDVALASDGTGVAAWTTHDPTGATAFAAVRDAAGAWGPASLVAQLTPLRPTTNGRVSTAASAGGAFYVVASPDVGGPILLARGTAGTLGAASTIGTGQNARAAIDAAGRAVVVFEAWQVMNSVICATSL